MELLDSVRRETPVEKWRRRSMGFLCWLGILAALAVILGGCALVPKPVCPDAEAVVLETNDGRVFFAFDIETLPKWQDAIRKEARGECVWRKKGEL